MASRGWAALAVCAAALVVTLAGCASFTAAPGHTTGSAPSVSPSATASATQVYYTYPTGIPLPSGASAPNGGKVVAFDGANGAAVWRYTLPTTQRPILFQPIEVDGVVYASSYADDPRATTLDALDAHTGKLLWSHKTPGTFVNQPVIVGDAIYVSAHQQATPSGYTGLLQRLDVRTGAPRWQVALPESPSPATVVGDIVYLTGMGNVLGSSESVALDAATGATRWSYTSTAQLSTIDPRVTDSDTLLAPMVAGSVVSLISTIRDSNGFAIQSVLALDITTGKPRWSYSTGGIVGAPQLAAGVLYISASVPAGNTSDSSLMALRMTDGKLLWRRPALAGHGLVNGLTFAGSQGGSGTAQLLASETTDPSNGQASAALVALAPDDGRMLWTTPLGTNAVVGSPLVVGGLALTYVMDETTGPGIDRLVAVRLSDGHVSWRQTGGSLRGFGDHTLWVIGNAVVSAVTQENNGALATYLVALRLSDGAPQWQTLAR